ncbi:disease resistance-like protein DSC1 [Pyrus communis]|uniref:disease resistance-like protein DSC1 n=1 Tax=Pyrus communis TaxID=23211 RepID=UPI0035C157CA
MPDARLTSHGLRLSGWQFSMGPELGPPPSLGLAHAGAGPRGLGPLFCPLSPKQMPTLGLLLPEVPMLSRLQANGCKSLKTVSSSRNAITKCWNRNELLREQLNFSNCRRLGYDARSSIMVDSQLRIMRVATASSKLKEENEDYVQRVYEPLVTMVCPGDEIPKWFVHQNMGASINVRLPANWFREGFLGFALTVVASDLFDPYVKFECKYNFKTGEGESHEINCYFNLEIGNVVKYRCSDLQHVFVLYKDLEYEKRTKWSPAFYNRVTEVSVHFRQEWVFLTVEKCGMCLLYAEDAEKLKCHVMSRQEQDEHAASGSGDLEASGSNESEEASGSDDL